MRPGAECGWRILNEHEAGLPWLDLRNKCAEPRAVEVVKLTCLASQQAFTAHKASNGATDVPEAEHASGAKF